MRTLKYFRIFLAIISILAITFLFIDLSGRAAANLDFMARIQLVPAFLSLNLIAIAVLIILTLLFGRIYCSVICPLGIFQDIVAWFGKLFSGKRKRKIGLYKYKKPHTKVRLTILVLFLIVVILGFLNIMALSLGAIIEPYSAFGRIVTAFVSPLYDAGNNYLAEASAQAGVYAYTPVSRAVPVVLFVIAGMTLLVVGGFALKGGRLYCNTICPVGTLLGYASKLSWLKPRINTDKCNSCGSCQRHCKSQCIDSQNHVIDYSRCVDCFDCINVCNKKAIIYAPAKAKSTERVKDVKTDSSKRVFMASLATLSGAMLMKGAGNVVEKVTDGGLTPLKKRQVPQRKVRIVPPGAISQAHINAHCVGCQLCIQACPNGLLKMSTDLSTLMQPVLSYNENYCTPECTKCSNVCPAGVFEPLDEVMKSSWKVGTAVVDLNACISASGIDLCGNCSRHCPAGAIEMVGEEGQAMPIVNEKACIGCGACEVHCPVGTVASMEANQPAIHIEGVSPQRLI